MSLRSLGRFGTLELLRDSLIQEGPPYRAVALRDLRMVEIRTAARGWLLLTGLLSLACAAVSVAYGVGYDSPSSLEVAGVATTMGLLLTGAFIGFRTTLLVVHIDGGLWLEERIGGRRRAEATMFAEKILAARLGKYGVVKPNTIEPSSGAPPAGAEVEELPPDEVGAG